MSTFENINLSDFEEIPPVKYAYARIDFTYSIDEDHKLFVRHGSKVQYSEKDGKVTLYHKGAIITLPKETFALRYKKAEE